MPPQRFRYGPRGPLLFFSLLFFGVCGGVFLQVARSGGELRLFPTMIYVSGAPVYAFAVLSFGFVALGITSYVISRRKGPRELVIMPDAFELPKSVWAKASTRVERSQVLRYAAQDVMGTRTLSVFTHAGPVHVSNRLVGDDGYQALLAWVERR